MELGCFESTFLLPSGAWYVGCIVRHSAKRTVAVCAYEPAVGVGDTLVEHEGQSCGSCMAQSALDGTLLVCFGADHELSLHSSVEPAVAVGSGVPGFADGCGRDAAFYLPYSAAAMLDGMFVVADTGNSALRMVSRAGDVCTLAGSACKGFVDGVGAAARFNGPQGLGVLPSGDVVVADTRNHVLRRVTPGGVVTTLAHRFDLPQDVAVDSDGAVFVADSGNARLCCLSPDLASMRDVPLPAGVVPTRVSVDYLGRALVEGDDASMHVIDVAPAVLDTLQGDYAALLDSAAFADVTLVAGHKTFAAHRSVLAARCPYFAALFAGAGAGGMASPQPGDHVAMHGITARALRAALAFIYAGTVPEVGGLFLREVLSAADHLLLDGLRRACHAALPACLTQDNAVDWLLWAHDAGTQHARHLTEVYVTQHLVNIHSENPAEFLRLMHAPCESIASIMRLYAIVSAAV